MRAQGLLALVCALSTFSRAAGQEDEGGVEPERRVALAQSVFANSADGWGVVGDVLERRVEHGTFSVTDEGSEVWFFKAPPKFLGDQRLAYSGRLVYSFGHFHSDAAGRDPIMIEDLVLISELHNLTVLRAGLVQEWVYAQEIDVDLSPSSAWRLASGAPAAAEDLQRVLSSLSSLLIRGGFYHGRETAWIRDVHLYRRATPALPSEFADDAPPAPDAPPPIDAPITLPPRVRKRAVLERRPWEAEGGGEVQPYVAREAYDSLLELKTELEEAEEALRAAAAELQGKLAASAEEARRLRGALAEARDAQQRNAELADARGRNFKEAERARAAAEQRAGELAARLESAEQLRVQKQVRIEELLAADGAGVGGEGGTCAGGGGGCGSAGAGGKRARAAERVAARGGDSARGCRGVCGQGDGAGRAAAGEQRARCCEWRRGARGPPTARGARGGIGRAPGAGRGGGARGCTGPGARVRDPRGRHGAGCSLPPPPPLRAPAPRRSRPLGLWCAPSAALFARRAGGCGCAAHVAGHLRLSLVPDRGLSIPQPPPPRAHAPSVRVERSRAETLGP